MTNKIAVWVHGDSLSPTDPALHAHPDAPAVFVFDEPFLREAQLSFKRLMFLYESAEDALAGRSVGEIRRGVLVEELRAFCDEHGCTELHVTESVAPRFKTYYNELRKHMRVVVHTPQPLANWTSSAPRRFSHMWRKIQDEAMRPTGRGPEDFPTE